MWQSTFVKKAFSSSPNTITLAVARRALDYAFDLARSSHVLRLDRLKKVRTPSSAAARVGPA